MMLDAFTNGNKNIPGGLGEAIDKGLGGKGSIGQIVDLGLAGKPTKIADFVFFGYGVQTSNVFQNVFTSPSSNYTGNMINKYGSN